MIYFAAFTLGLISLFVSEAAGELCIASDTRAANQKPANRARIMALVIMIIAILTAFAGGSSL